MTSERERDKILKEEGKFRKVPNKQRQREGGRTWRGEKGVDRRKERLRRQIEDRFALRDRG